jgi:hypothetical protein
MYFKENDYPIRFIDTVGRETSPFTPLEGQIVGGSASCGPAIAASNSVVCCITTDNKLWCKDMITNVSTSNNIPVSTVEPSLYLDVPTKLLCILASTASAGCFKFDHDLAITDWSPFGSAPFSAMGIGSLEGTRWVYLKKQGTAQGLQYFFGAPLSAAGEAGLGSTTSDAKFIASAGSNMTILTGDQMYIFEVGTLFSSTGSTISPIRPAGLLEALFTTSAFCPFPLSQQGGRIWFLDTSTMSLTPIFTPTPGFNFTYAWGFDGTLPPICDESQRPSPPNLFSCSGGQWVSIGSVDTEVIIVNGPTVINGSLAVTDVTFTGLRSSLNVSGCASINGTITLQLTQEEYDAIAQGSTPRTTLLTSSCSPTGTSIFIQSPSTSCTKVVAASETSSNSLLAVFSVDQTACSKAKSKLWWIILVAVIGGLVLVGIILALIFSFNPTARECIRPYSKRRIN